MGKFLDWISWLLEGEPENTADRMPTPSQLKRERESYEKRRVWVEEIHREALDLLTDRWQTFPQLRERYRGETRPDLLERALFDNDRCEKRDVLGYGIRGGYEFRRRQ